MAKQTDIDRGHQAYEDAKHDFTEVKNALDSDLGIVKLHSGFIGKAGVLIPDLLDRQRDPSTAEQLAGSAHTQCKELILALGRIELAIMKKHDLLTAINSYESRTKMAPRDRFSGKEEDGNGMDAPI